MSHSEITGSVTFSAFNLWETRVTVAGYLTERTPVIAASQHAPAPASYHVKYGDTLSQIALDFYGNASDYPKIAVYDNIANPDLIYAGDTLKIPDAAFVPESRHVPKHSAAHHARHHAPKPSFTPIHAASGNMTQIAKYFHRNGATRVAAAGIAACIWGESGGNPLSVGSGGFGLIGWTGNNIGLPRGYFGPTGNVTVDMNIQLAGVIGYINANGGFGALNAAVTPTEAAQVFSSKFERPAVRFSDIHYGGPGDPNAIYLAI